MKKTLIILVSVFILGFLFVTIVSSKDISKINFKGNEFFLYKVDSDDNNYDMVNRFFAEGLEQNERRDELVLFYSKRKLPEKSEQEDLKKEYSKIYMVGKTFSADDKYVISFAGNAGGKKLYSILKFQKNTDIEGYNVAQLYMNMPNINNQSTVKDMDAKYFDYFAKYDFPLLVDEYGKTFPQKRKISVLNEVYTMKFCRYYAKSKTGNNTFVDGENNLSTYKSTVRINYIPNFHSPTKLINEIIDELGKNEGFRVITNEKISKNEYIFSYVENIVNLKKGEEFKEHSIIKIESHGNKLHTIEISTRIPFKNNIETNNAISAMNTKYTKYFKENKVPELIQDNFGEQPTFEDQNYFNYNHGVK